MWCHLISQKNKLAVFYVLQIALIHVCTEECGIRETDIVVVVVVVMIGIVRDCLVYLQVSHLNLDSILLFYETRRETNEKMNIGLLY